jgi:hypothetical protein
MKFQKHESSEVMQSDASSPGSQVETFENIDENPKFPGNKTS